MRAPVALTTRLTSIDTLRGIVMILMALDHVRDYFGVPGISPDKSCPDHCPSVPDALDHAHLRAGLLSTDGNRGVSVPQTKVRSRVVAVPAHARPVADPSGAHRHSLSGIPVQLRLPGDDARRHLGVGVGDDRACGLGVAAVVGRHDDRSRDDRGAQPPGRRAIGQSLWVVLHQPGFVINRPGFVVFASYTLIPWIGVTAAGYVLGQVFHWSPRTPANVSPAAGRWIDGRVRRLADLQRLRRSRSMGATALMCSLPCRSST